MNQPTSERSVISASGLLTVEGLVVTGGDVVGADATPDLQWDI